MSEDYKPGPIAWMAKHSVAANLLMCLFLVGGLVLATTVKQEVFPEFTTDVVRVDVAYPGASPKDVEQGIVLAVEDGVQGLDGIKRVTSVANEGQGSVVIELLTSAVPSKSVQDIKNAVDRIRTFPEDAERPIVSLVEARKNVISILLSGDQEAANLRRYAEGIREDLIQLPGVTLVEIALAPKFEIAIEIPQRLLREYGLTLDDVANRIRASSLDLPAGEVRTRGGRVLLRTEERRYFASQFADVPLIETPSGNVLTLGEVAELRDGFDESDQDAKLNNKPAIRIEVFRVGNETPQSVSKAVKDYMAKIEGRLPEGVELSVWRDSSEVYKDRMSLLLKNAGLGLCLVLLLLGLFLEPTLAFWVTLGIPISIIGSFVFLPMTDVSINMISLFAFIITLGIIVDDAVVVGESIHEKREKGLSRIRAAIEGAREISGPIVFAVLTNIIAFCPLFFVPGISGKFFGQVPTIVVAVFIVSLIESLFILPAHLGHQGKGIWVPGFVHSARKFCSESLNNFIQNRYAPMIGTFVSHRYIVIAIAMAALFVAFGVVRGGHLPFSFLPRIDADLITAQAVLPVESHRDVTDEVQDRVVSAAYRAIGASGGAEISRGVYSQVGKSLVGFGPGPNLSFGGGGHIIATQVSLVPSNLREISGTEFARRWREEIGDLVEVKSLTFKAETGASEGPAIELSLSHPSDRLLEQAARDFVLGLKSYAGVTDIEDGIADGKPQQSYTLTPLAKSLGLTSRDVARQLRSAYYGAEALRQQRDRNEVKVIVRYPRIDREALGSLDSLLIRTPSGGEIPLKEAVFIEEARADVSISRKNGRRVVTVTADVDEQLSSAGKIYSSLFAVDIPKLQKRYPGLTYSVGGEREAKVESLRALGVGFAIALIGIYAMLAIPFNSYVQPLIVMLSIPFGIIGAVAGHYLLGYTLSIMSMFGVVALSGVVVNDSLVLVVAANRFREAGMSAFEAVRAAAIRRFRPILLTSLTTFFGLAPMILETSVQARFLIPMAISIGFGILFATVIILIVVPAVYLIVEDLSLIGKKYRLLSPKIA